MTDNESLKQRKLAKLDRRKMVWIPFDDAVDQVVREMGCDREEAAKILEEVVAKRHSRYH